MTAVTGLVRGELLKALSTRTVVGFLAGVVGFSLLNAVIIAAASGPLDDVAEKEEALSVLPILLLVWGLVGVAGEYRHRTAAPAALAAGTGRSTLLAGRFAVYGVIGLVLGASATAAGTGLALALLTDDPGPALTTAQVTEVAAGNLAACVLATVLGAAIGSLVRNQILGVILVLVLDLAVLPLLAGAQEALSNLTPFGALSVLSRMTHDTTITVTQAGLVVAGWTAAAVVTALISERVRDLA